YYLVQELAGTGGSTPLPTPDAIGAIAMSATTGKVALVSASPALAGTCPTGPAIIDFVGFGTPNCSENSPAPTLNATTAATRSLGVDTDNNAADFTAGPPTPRNSGATAVPLAGT